MMLQTKHIVIPTVYSFSFIVHYILHHTNGQYILHNVMEMIGTVVHNIVGS
jgi:hypothetical protein